MIIENETNNSDYIELLNETYNLIKIDGDSESIAIIKLWLIDYYKIKHMYKEITKLFIKC